MTASRQEALRGRTVAYVLSDYPVLSQTFVRDEIMTLRASGVDVDVTSIGRGDQERIPLSWSGPYRTVADLGWGRAVLDLLWWLGRPRAVVRLVKAVRAGGRASQRSVLRGVPTAARRLAGRDVQVVHTHFGWNAMIQAVYVGALLDRPVSVTLHAVDIYRAPPGFARRVATTDAVVTVCRYNVGRLADLGVDVSDVVVVPCGVDVHVPVVPPDDPARVVSVGRLVPKKGMDLLLRAFRAVVDAVPGARLDIVGEGPDEADLRALCTELGLDGHVTFVGVLGHAGTLARISAAGVFALACRVASNGDSDAMPVSLREAMARARPVVTTAVAGIPENVDDEVGWLVPSDDVDALAAALLASVRDHAEAARRGAAARRRQVEHYSLEQSVAALTQRWAALAARGRG